MTVASATKEMRAKTVARGAPTMMRNAFFYAMAVGGGGAWPMHRGVWQQAGANLPSPDDWVELGDMGQI
jgi:hypothetical protein